MHKKTVGKSEIELVVGQLQAAAERNVRMTKRTEYNQQTKTYTHHVHEVPGRKNEIKTTWGNEILDRGFTMIPNLLLDNYTTIGIRDKHIILIEFLLRYGQNRIAVFPSQRTIAAKTGYSVKTIQRLIRELKMKGYLAVFRRYIKPDNQNPRRTSNVYELRGLSKKLMDVAKKEK